MEWEMDEDGKFVCRFNEGCHCDLPTCGCCGWNPEVARKRLRQWLEENGLPHQCDHWFAMTKGGKKDAT